MATVNSAVTTTVHDVSYEAQSRELEPDGPWRVHEATGLAWGRCSCGFRAEGPCGEPLPKDDIAARVREHVEQAKAT